MSTNQPITVQVISKIKKLGIFHDFSWKTELPEFKNLILSMAGIEVVKQLSLVFFQVVRKNVSMIKTNSNSILKMENLKLRQAITQPSKILILLPIFYLLRFLIKIS